MTKYTKIKLRFLMLLCFSVLLSCNSKTDKTITLKLMSYNIRHGKGLDTILDLSRAAHIIKSYAPDICALQEIDNFCKRTDSIEQTAYLAQETKMVGTFGKFMTFQGGAYGMATLTKKPIVSTKMLVLPDAKYEPRISIVHEIKINTNHSIAFANVHFDWISGEEGNANRLKQAKALIAYINTLNKATIITGDFNCTPNSEVMQYFLNQGFVFVEKGADNLSFQGEYKVEIDHLIYRNTSTLTLDPKHVKLLDVPVVSDHRPLVAELEIDFH